MRGLPPADGGWEGGLARFVAVALFSSLSFMNE
jgi:hypothetical protein